MSELTRSNDDDRCIEITIESSVFKVFSNGKILRMLRSKKWKEIKNKQNHAKGYNVIMIEKKQYMRARIIAHAFLGLDLLDKTLITHFINKNRMDCNINNIVVNNRSVTSLYNTSCDGWVYNSYRNKYTALITFKGISKNLGDFETADEAHKIYIKEKSTILQNIL